MRALLAWNSHETRKRFVNDPVAAHGKHAIEVRCLRRKRRRMPSFTGGLNLNALEGSRGRTSRISQKSCAASAIPISCRWIYNCQRFAHARHVRTSPNRRTCGEISFGGIIQRNGDVPSTKNTSKHKSNRTARGTFGRRGGGNSKKKSRPKAAGIRTESVFYRPLDGRFNATFTGGSAISQLARNASALS